MCDPVSATTALTIAGVVGEVVGEFQETEAENKALDYNAQAAERNVTLLTEQKANVQMIGTRREADIFLGARELAGQQKTAFAAGGVRVGAGSAADVLQRTGDVAEADALTVKYNTAQELKGIDVRIEDFREKAKFLRESKKDPLLEAGGTLLTEAPKILKRFGGGS